MDEWQAKTYGLIQAHLDAAVPLLTRELLEEGGPTEYHYQRVREHGQFLAEHGDAILYPQKRTTAEAMNKLVESVAVLAFCPGGIRLFGCEFDASGQLKSQKVSKHEILDQDLGYVLLHSFVAGKTSISVEKEEKGERGK